MARDLATVVGRYGAPGYGTVRFVDRDGHLHFEWGALAGKATRIDPSRMMWQFRGGGRLRFVFNDKLPVEGAATGVVLRGVTLARL